MIFFPEQTPLSETVLGRTREGNEITEYAWGEGERQILFLSGFAPADAPLGRALLKPLVCPAVSKAAGWFLSTRLSKVFIKPFIRSSCIDMTLFEPTE